jgi:purine-binding chemotaxis protein CheW
MLGRKERTDPEKSLVGFVVGDIEYAVPIRSVREIINPVPIVELPHLPSAVVGVADHRGEVIPLIDLRARFGVAPATDRRGAKWVLSVIGGQTAGLIVDKVTEVFGFGSEDMKVAPRVSEGEKSRAIAGVISYRSKLIFVLDTSRFEELLSQMDIEEIERAVANAL